MIHTVGCPASMACLLDPLFERVVTPTTVTEDPSVCFLQVMQIVSEAPITMQHNLCRSLVLPA